MTNNNNLIPFQWSIKLENGEIYVAQTNTSDELGLAIEEIKTKFLKDTIQSFDNVKPSTSQPSELPLCPKCGSKQGISKKGNVFCLAKCWLNR